MVCNTVIFIYFYLVFVHIHFYLDFQPGAVDSNPFQWPGFDIDEVTKADVLLDYEALARNELLSQADSCDAEELKNFESDLADNSECVDEQARCTARKMKCNKNGL